MWVSTVLGAIVLVLIIMNEAISACRFFKVKGSYMWVSTVQGAIVLVWIIMNEAISACRFLKIIASYLQVFYITLCRIRIVADVLLKDLSSATF